MTLSKVKEFYRVSYDPEKSEPIPIQGGTYYVGGIYYTYDFAKYGVDVFFDKFLQVDTLQFNRPFSGKIDGVSVGDTKEHVVKLKGEPLYKNEWLDFNNLHVGGRFSSNDKVEVWVYKSGHEGVGEELTYTFGLLSGKVRMIRSTNGN